MQRDHVNRNGNGPFNQNACPKILDSDADTDGNPLATVDPVRACIVPENIKATMGVHVSAKV